MLRRLFSTAIGPLLVTALATAQSASQPQTDPAQAPPVTFKVEVNYVEVDARVVDRRGNFIRDLKKEDFQILEDGKPQPLSTFALVDIPVVAVEKPLFASAPIEPDVATNATSNVDGRLYVIMLDDLHTGALRSQRVKDAARRFIQEKLGANDRVAIVATSGRNDLGQDFTQNRRLLLEVVDKFIGQKLNSSTLERIDQFNQNVPLGELRPNQRVEDPYEAERQSNARRTFESLRRIVEWMSGIQGRRKALLFISEGIDYDVTDVFSNPDGTFNLNGATNASDILTDTREVIAAASRSNVTIFAVDPRGLATMGDELITMGSQAEAKPIDDGSGSGMAQGRRTNLGIRSMLNELQVSQDNLRTMSEQTGGFAAVNSNDLTTAFDRIVAENSSYYMLGYYPANEKRDGRFRKIEVRVLNHPDVDVRARKGYAAPRGNAPVAKTKVSATPGLSAAAAAELNEALRSPLPLSGFTMNVNAMAFRGVTGSTAIVAVLIEMPGEKLRFVEKDGKFQSDLAVSIGAVDKDGKLAAGEQPRLDFGLRPETHDRVIQHGVRILSHLQLPPGRYQLRVAAREGLGQTRGAVHYDLEVPDFSKAPLLMSGVGLMALASPSMIVRTNPSFGSPLPVMPTARREFSSSDELVAYSEVYDNQPTVPHKVSITTTLQFEDGLEVLKHVEERSRDEFDGSRGEYPYATTLPLKGFKPGLYVLKIEARSTLGASPSVSRTIQFRIR